MGYKVYKNKNGKYSVKKDGAKRATRVFDTLLEANNYCASIDQNFKESKEYKRNNTKIILTIVFLIIALCVAVYLYYPNLKINKEQPFVIDDVIYDDFQIHFLTLGNEYTGDSTYIKAGDVDILIDAGSRQESSKTIIDYVDKYCRDKKLEYVIATHADRDHIAAFTDSSKTKGIFSYYEVDTIIDFALTNKNTQTYQNYVELREKEVAQGAKHYTSKECFNNENGAKDTYILSDKVEMKILYNKYYFETSSDENNYSVCLLFTYKENGKTHDFLFTGDLEKEGEEALAEYYKINPGLSHVELFKGGHHGSNTSSNECLLELITPSICCVCCCSGSTEYTKNYLNTFPTQNFINRISKYTDQVYVTTMYNEEKNIFEDLNGNIIVSCEIVLEEGEWNFKIAVVGTNNTIKLKDSKWFSHIVYIDDLGKIVDKQTQGAKQVPCRSLPDNWK